MPNLSPPQYYLHCTTSSHPASPRTKCAFSHRKSHSAAQHQTNSEPPTQCFFNMTASHRHDQNARRPPRRPQTSPTPVARWTCGRGTAHLQSHLQACHLCTFTKALLLSMVDLRHEAADPVAHPGVEVLKDLSEVETNKKWCESVWRGPVCKAKFS